MSETTPLRIVFMGTPEFAVPTLEALLSWPGCRVVAVVTAADKPAGRGRQLSESAVKQAAVAHGVPVLQPTNLKAPDFQDELRGYAADLQVVVAFRMLPEAVWNMPPRGSINVHASLLPQYRGAAPINWALIHGERETGVTSFFLQHEIDTGNLIFQDVVPIADEDDFGTLYGKLKVAGAALALRTVQAIAAGTAPSIPQVASAELRSAPKIQKETGRLDFAQPAAALVNLVRGLSPIPTAFATLPDGRTLKVFRAQAVADKAADHAAGQWLTDSRTYLRVQTAEGQLDLLDVQLEGKKRMPVGEFLRGFNTAALNQPG
ncbi:methionyl-tRNA formyltransferase [Hymenobacter busanensis]|uniref:Methionyl-tRNA formyltransferase n=1 Tax=Hymenobacter busanensis TaxID=2607656 RepID=A0A7L4ZWR9_9BACT|nr:methionyl-tRNA formyltransferase [Hymenobacter busanensis]KAA9327203.1 methionyl-tRNA formyltransferase [Hymenobacter busanensis]QHJ05870.1 methionyl-tRNA formyltransferase [Hymenobacter busanensis]